MKRNMEKSIKPYIHLVVALLFISGSELATANCDQSITKIEDTLVFPDSNSKTRFLESLASECKGSPAYALKLSEFYISARQYPLAEKLLTEAIQAKTPMDSQLRFALADMYFVSSQLEKSRIEAEKIVARYPEWGAGYFVLGSALLFQDKNIAAVANLEKAAALMNEAEAYCSLAYAYHKLGKNVETIQAMEKAVSLDKRSYANPIAVPAWVYAFAKLDRLDDARKLLIIHQHYRPESQTDPEFARAVKYVEEKLKKRKG